MKKLVLAFIAISLTILFVITQSFFESIRIENSYFRINKGESALSIANRLAEKKLIKSRFAFYWFTRLSGKAKDLDYGLYHFEGSLNSWDLLKKIESGQVQLSKITIPEGLNLKQVFLILENKNFGDFIEFDNLSKNAEFIKELTGFEITSLEGFIYPETYFFPENAQERYILKKMVEQHFSQTKDLDFSHSKEMDYYQILILASIVEKEAQFDEEKPTIASVYLNRLEVDMKLQADPTISYILEQKGKKRKKIYYKDLKIDSPYNTYLYKGLPPTPICSPSKSAIKAVLEPEETDYFYFFASGGGKHTFSQTYSQHLSRQRN
jgi:UPF0755 protein